MISYSPDTEQPFDLGTVAFHECNSGFALVGTETRTCVVDDPELVVGIFTEGPPTCERKEIPHFNLIFILIIIKLLVLLYLVCKN